MTETSGIPQISRGPAAQFGQFVLENRERIIRHWITAVDRSPEVPASEDLTYRQLLDHLPELCHELGSVLKRPDVPAIRHQAARDAGEHGRKRWQQGYNLAELIREVCLIRDTIIEVWLDVFARENAQLDRQSIEPVRKTVTRFFDDLVIESAVQFASEQIDQVRAVQAALYNAESAALSARSEILHHVSHDLREPLGAINFAAQVLFADENLSTDAKEMVQVILRNSKVEARNIDQLLVASEMALLGKKSAPAASD